MTRALDRRGSWKIMLAAAVATAGMVMTYVCLVSQSVPRTAGQLRHSAYLWQREWSPAVQQAIHDHASDLEELIVLAAEVTWHSGQPQITRVNLDLDALQVSGRPVGLALRIGPYSGPFASHSPITAALTTVCADLVRQAEDAHLALCELQIDFDCPESKLAGYGLWLDAIRRTVHVPVTITTLPSWLNRREFARLIDAADGYVLQVHSLERPKTLEAATTLCDPAAVSRAVEQAARLKHPFRVALPTYGYRIAFNRQQRFLGISAEGPAPTWPSDAVIREVRADPVALAGLIQKWMADRPIYLQGVVWYRLPVSDDRMNWSWSTLAEVMAGRSPKPFLRIEVRRPEPNLAEIDLINVGQADAALPATVDLRWNGADFVAADALAGYERADTEDGCLQLRLSPSPVQERLAPGQHRMIGWIRLSQDMEVQGNVRP